jgi:hypothetical protein
MPGLGTLGGCSREAESVIRQARPSFRRCQCHQCCHRLAEELSTRSRSGSTVPEYPPVTSCSGRQKTGSRASDRLQPRGQDIRRGSSASYPTCSICSFSVHSNVKVLWKGYELGPAHGTKAADEVCSQWGFGASYLECPYRSKNAITSIHHNICHTRASLDVKIGQSRCEATDRSTTCACAQSPLYSADT